MGVKALSIAVVLCFFVSACGKSSDGAPTSQAEKPAPAGPGGLTPAAAEAGNGVGQDEAGKRFVVAFNAIYPSAGNSCKQVACALRSLGSYPSRLPDASVTEPGLEIYKSRYVFSDQLELQCVYKSYSIAAVVEASCQLSFNFSGKKEDWVTVSRGAGPFAHVYRATLVPRSTSPQSRSTLNGLAYCFSKVGVDQREPEVEVRMESGGIVRLPRIRLTCGLYGNEVESCTFTGVGTGHLTN